MGKENSVTITCLFCKPKIYHPMIQRPINITRSLRALITTSTPEGSAGSTPCLLALTCCPKKQELKCLLADTAVKIININTNKQNIKPVYKFYLALVVSQLHCLQEVLYPLTETFFSAFYSYCNNR